MSDILEQVKKAGSPIIDGQAATFVWEGRERVRLKGDFNYWRDGSRALEMEPTAPGVLTRTLQFPPDAYIEYAFALDGHNLNDPFNPRRTPNGMGRFNNYFRMPQAVETRLVRPVAGVPRGEVSRHRVPGEDLVVGAYRTVHLYRPPVEGPVPLLVVFDGRGYLRRARLNVIVDNLIAQGRIRPLALALVDPGRRGRAVEYACSDTTVAFVLDCVLRLAKERLDLLDTAAHPGLFGLMGASMGGLISLYTALRAPEIFGHVLCQSGAFGADHPDYRIYHRSVIEDLIEYGPVQPVKIWLDAGRYEWFIDPNRRMKDCCSGAATNLITWSITAGIITRPGATSCGAAWNGCTVRINRILTEPVPLFNWLFRPEC